MGSCLCQFCLVGRQAYGQTGGQTRTEASCFGRPQEPTGTVLWQGTQHTPARPRCAQAQTRVVRTLGGSTPVAAAAAEGRSNLC
jgi:hypothetical protein